MSAMAQGSEFGGAAISPAIRGIRFAHRWITGLAARVPARSIEALQGHGRRKRATSWGRCRIAPFGAGGARGRVRIEP